MNPTLLLQMVNVRSCVNPGTADRKGIPPGPDQGGYPSYLCFFCHLKLELLTQLPALNEGKYVYL